MRYCRFQTPAGPQYGQVQTRSGRDIITNLLPPPEHDPWTRLSGLAFDPIPLDQANLLAPVVPSKIVCVGRNYRDHAAELGNDVPAEPLLFLKPPSSLLAPGAAVQMTALSKRIDFEGELAVVIGKRCRKMAEG